MGTYRQIHYHVVFSTKNRMPSLDKSNRELLYKYVWGILKKNRCYLIASMGLKTIFIY